MGGILSSSLNPLSWCLVSRVLEMNNRSFRITPLGEGGFSMIFLAQDLSTQEYFALKKMTCIDAETVKEAMREVEIYGFFDHPNIIKCLDSAVVEAGDGAVKDVYMLLPLYKRGTLQDLIDANKEHGIRFTETEILEIAEGIAKALRELHSYKLAGSDQLSPLAHRDVKPANVLLENDHTPVLMDFGSVANAVVRIENRAQALSLQDLAAERCSMAYRAPELFDVKSQCVVDEKVDIWSFGCLIYAMAYGENPFEHVLHEPGGSIALAVLNGSVTYPSDDPYSRHLRDLLVWTLQTDPTKRPTIRELLVRFRDLRK